LPGSPEKFDLSPGQIRCYDFLVSTAREIEDAIRSLPAPERDKLLHNISSLFPELRGDAEWERIIGDARPRPALTELLDETQAEFRGNPDAFPELTERDLAS
jgi:hypothetical protein